MPMKNTKNTYGWVAKTFHWTLSLLIIIMLIVGYFLDDLPKDIKGTVSNLHKLTGVTILFLMLLRLLWTSINIKPALPVNTPYIQVLAQRCVHWALYLTVIAMPLAGWIGSSAAGKAPMLGNTRYPLPVPQDKALVSAAFDMHGWLAIVILCLLSIHVSAALYHHFICRDNVLKRMLP